MIIKNQRIIVEEGHEEEILPVLKSKIENLLKETIHKELICGVESDEEVNNDSCSFNSWKQIKIILFNIANKSESLHTITFRTPTYEPQLVIDNEGFKFYYVFYLTETTLSRFDNLQLLTMDEVDNDVPSLEVYILEHLFNDDSLKK